MPEGIDVVASKNEQNQTEVQQKVITKPTNICLIMNTYVLHTMGIYSSQNDRLVYLYPCKEG